MFEDFDFSVSLSSFVVEIFFESALETRDREYDDNLGSFILLMVDFE